jgi:predicted transglutaminase-like cysteine proteinase
MTQKLEQIVETLGKNFVYDWDKKYIIDHWSVMKPGPDGKYRGDCDDFALTALWKICDENLFKFILNVLILHRYRMIFAKTPNGEGHLVGYAKGKYFDNWTRQAMDKEDFLRETGHKMKFPVLSPISIWYILVGLFTR